MPAMRRRALCVVIASAALAPWSIEQALAQEYPNRPVRIVVPFAAGGPADIFARVLSQRLQESLGQTFVVENRPGAGSVIGTDAVAKSPADGYTLLMMSTTHTVNESLMPTKPFVLMRDFVPVAPVNYADMVLVAHPSVGVATLQELIARAKASPKKLNYASSGPGTPYHLAGEMLKLMAGVDITHVPYKGSSGARTDVLGGQIEMMFDSVTTMAPNIRAGKVRALGATGRTRSNILPEVPTVAEAGVPGYECVIWLGMMAPAATPRPIVARLNGEIQRILGQATLREDWAKQGAVPMLASSEQFGAFLREDIEKWSKVVKAANMKADQ